MSKVKKTENKNIPIEITLFGTQYYFSEFAGIQLRNKLNEVLDSL